MKIKCLYVLAAMVAFCSSSCLYDSPDDLAQPVLLCDTTFCYKFIKPIVESECATSGCHVSGGAGPGDYTQWSEFKAEVKSGNVKTRINLDKLDDLFMPQGNELTSSDLKTLNNWIDAGAQGCW